MAQDDKALVAIADKWLPDFDTPSLDARYVSLKAALAEAQASDKARIEALELALKPFAECAERIRPGDYDNDRPAYARVSDYRLARATLETPNV